MLCHIVGDVGEDVFRECAAQVRADHVVGVFALPNDDRFPEDFAFYSAGYRTKVILIGGAHYSKLEMSEVMLRLDTAVALGLAHLKAAISGERHDG